MYMSFERFTTNTALVREGNTVPNQCSVNFDEPGYAATYDDLSSKICFNAVQYYTYLCGIFTKIPKDAMTGGDSVSEAFYSIMKNPPQIKSTDDLMKVPPGVALLFTGYNIGSGCPRPREGNYISHAMVSLAPGYAMGSNNALLGPGDNKWEELALCELLDFNGDQGVFAKITKNRLGFLYAVMLRDTVCLGYQDGKCTK